MAGTWQYLVATFFQGTWSFAGPTPVNVPFNASIADMLAACGAEGWELISVPADPNTMWIFKRG